MTDASQPENLSGKQLGGYEFLNVIGYGGMATVYRARQLSMQRIVALKVLPRQFMQDDTYMQRFHREVEIVSRLEHRNIVPVHDYGEFDRQPYIVMRYMPAGSVDDLLRSGPLDFELTQKIIEQIAPALDYAHTKGVLHRDLKPSNILMDDNGDAYLTDFGIARVLGENMGGISITTKHVVGTPAYMSPEQAQGQSLDNRSDIYSLGVTLFEMATGHRPFVAETPYGVAVLQVTTPPPAPRTLNVNIPVPLENVIMRTMKKKPDERYNSAILLSEAVRSALDPDAASIHDTMIGVAKPTKPVEVRQRVQPAYAAPAVPITPPPPRYPTPRTPRSSRAVPAVNPRRVFRRRQRPNNLWMSAAIGGIIGCGLLTLLVILLALMLSGNPTAANGSRQSGDNQNAPSSLDPTSEAARRALLGYEAEE